MIMPFLDSMSARLGRLIGMLTDCLHGLTPRVRELRRIARQKNWTELELRTRRLLAESPENREVLSMLAESLRLQNRLEESIEVALRATSGLGNGWKPHFTVGLALKELRRMDEACGQLRKAASLAPRKARVLRHLIEAVVEVEGMREAAVEYAARCGRSSGRSHIVLAKIRDIREWVHGSGSPVLEAGESEEIPYETPRVWGSSSAVETHLVRYEKPCVTELSGARVFGQSGIVLTSDGTALSETAGHPQFGRFVNLADGNLIVANADGQALLDTSSFQSREIEGGILLAGSASNAFGHWFPDFLPRLQFLRMHPDFQKLPIIVDEEMPQTHFDHLRRFASNPLILLKANESLVCGRLLMATSPSFIPVWLFPNDVSASGMPGLSPRAMQFLRSESQLVNPDEPRRGRWFLGRKNMSWRRLLNEVEIGGALANAGFETIYLEDKEMEEQIRIFQRAEWIVAPNGSALLNLIFSDPSVKLLVLSQPGLFNWGTFQGPMRNLGYNPVWLCGENVTAAGQKHSDYHVPVQQVREALQEMGLDKILSD